MVSLLFYLENQNISSEWEESWTKQIHTLLFLLFYYFNLLNGILRLSVFSRFILVDTHSIASERVPDKVAQFNIPNQDIVLLKVHHLNLLAKDVTYILQTALNSYLI